MKILFISKYYEIQIGGGVAVVLRVLMEATCNSGHEVIALVTSEEKGLRRETINGMKVYYAGIINNYWTCVDPSRSKIRKLIWHTRDIYNKAMQEHVRNILRIEKPDVVSCHDLSGWSISVWDTIRKEGIPIVQVLHDYYFLCLRSAMFKDNRLCKRRCFECKIVRLLHRYKSRQVKAVIGVSFHVLNRVIEAGFFSGIMKDVVYNAQVIPETPMRERRDEFTFGFIGRLSQSKGIEWLLEEFRRSDFSKVFLKIAGEGNRSYEEKLKRLVGNDSRISFLGFSKPEDFYPSIDVLVVPSIGEEALGMVAIEACAYHVPVVTSAVGGLKEIIKDGYNGLYCDVENPHTLSTAMYRILDDRELFEKLRGNASLSVRSFLDTNRLISEYEAVYKRL